jgi:hypothetical protein
MPDFIPPEAAAELIGTTKANLAQRRYLGLPPRYYKPTPRKVLYKRADLLEWIEKSAIGV